MEEKTLTIPNKSVDAADGTTASGQQQGASGQQQEARRQLEMVQMLDPLGVMPEAGHLLPQAAGGLNLITQAREPESGAMPLKNRRREEFCRVLTGWGGDGCRKKNYEAYEAVYGKGGATARVQSSWLLSDPEVRARVEYLELKVEEAKRHDYLAAQQEIDELRLGLVERGKRNSKLAAVALAAARDFEAAHGLRAKAERADTVEEVAAVAGDVLGGVRAILAKVMIKKAGV